MKFSIKNEEFENDEFGNEADEEIVLGEGLGDDGDDGNLDLGLGVRGLYGFEKDLKGVELRKGIDLRLVFEDLKGY